MVVTADCGPRLPADAQDDERDGQADKRVGDGGADGDNDRRGDDRQRDVGVRASVVAVGDERGAVEAMSGAPADLGGDEVAQVPDNAGEREHPQVGGWTLVDEAENRLDPRHARADEDGRNDEQSRLALGSLRTHQEGDSQGNCGERVPEVVDEVGQQCDRTRQYEDERLSDGGEAEHSEGDEHGAHALARALDGVMNKAVGVAMVVMAGGMLLTAVRVVVLGMVMSKMHMLVLVDVSVLRRTHLTPPEARRCGPTCCDLGADARRGRWPVRATLPRGC